jgi:hypothetical protein
MGVGIALVLAAATFVWLDAEAICVEAAAPVRARTMTKARTMFFMGNAPKVVLTILKFRWTTQLQSQ